jgi:Yeast cell wall synthesis protein KRE9/KNH1
MATFQEAAISTSPWIKTCRLDMASYSGSNTRGQFVQLTSQLSFLKMQSTIREGGTVTNYSPRFRLLSVSSLSQPAQSNLPHGNFQGPPRELDLPAENMHFKRQSDPYTIPWSLQVGPTRYAPMQSHPPTKITKTQPTPQYPPSKIVLATTPLPPNKSIKTTVTQGMTWRVTQQENQVSKTSVSISR